MAFLRGGIISFGGFHGKEKLLRLLMRNAISFPKAPFNNGVDNPVQLGDVIRLESVHQLNFF